MQWHQLDYMQAICTSAPGATLGNEYGKTLPLPFTDDLLWQNFLSPQCRNCSRDPDHAHLKNTHSSQDFAWPTRVQNLKSLALAVAEILHGV